MTEKDGVVAEPTGKTPFLGNQKGKLFLIALKLYNLSY
jgi:hypothetical protein